MTELAGQKEPTIVHLVSHTHWDREWYEPFQTFRMRLVELIDQLLVRMEDDPRRPGEDLPSEASGVLRLPLGPWEIATIQLRSAGD